MRLRNAAPHGAAGGAAFAGDEYVVPLSAQISRDSAHFVLPMQCLGRRKWPDLLSLGEAARAIGVSQDTLRRWDRAGKIRIKRDERNLAGVPRSEVERRRPRRHRSGHALSACNRFPGVVRSVEVDGVMALIEIEAAPT